MSGTPKLEWAIIRLQDDNNWWVESISDDKHWDVDGLGIIDPRQIAHIADLSEPLYEYGFDSDILENAFFKFHIEREIEEGCIHLTRTKDSIFGSEEPLFALPDILDEEKGPYADFLEQATKFRVKLLNDMIDFEQIFTIEELEDEIREQQKIDAFEELQVHFLTQITSILEYVPKGFESDFEEEFALAHENEEDFSGIPDLVEEKIEEDETMKWVEEDEETEEYLPGDEDENGDTAVNESKESASKD